MKANNNVTAETIVNIVAKDPKSTGQTLYDYFQYCGLGEPSGEEIQLFEKKLKKIKNNLVD